MNQTVLITGASSGIGRELAVRYAREGCRLLLLGRDDGRLQDAANECRRTAATVETATIDVRNRAQMAEWIISMDRVRPISLVVANAGVMEGTSPDGFIEDADAGYDLIAINVGGVLNTVQPILPAMMNRARGQIAIISSIAAFVPLADSPSYCASKSAILSYGLSLRTLLANKGIRVNVVCPGYVTTPMSIRERGPKPFEMSAENAACIICHGLAHNRAVIAFPRLLAWVTRMNGFLPDQLRQAILRQYRFTVSEPAK